VELGIRVPGGAGSRSVRVVGRRQLARDYHGRRIAARDHPKSVMRRQLQGAGIARLDDAMQFALTRRGCARQQGLEQAFADAQRTEAGQDHQREFGAGVLRDVFGVCNHFAVAIHRQHDKPVAAVDGGEAVEQGLVGRVAVRKVPLVEAFAVHRGKKARHRGVIVRVGRAQPDIRQVGGPGLTRAHGTALLPGVPPWEEATTLGRWVAPGPHQRPCGRPCRAPMAGLPRRSRRPPL